MWDWLAYAAILALLFALADSRRLRLDAPAAPPPAPGEEAVPLSPLSPFNGARIVPIADGAGRRATAFSIGDHGAWLTAARAVQGCARLAVVIAPGKGAEAHATPLAGGQLAILSTVGGGPALPLAPSVRADDSFAPGFPHGAPGEAAVRPLGPAGLRDLRRDAGSRPLQAWVEVGRTDGLKGPLDGLEGAPVIDGMGRVEGVLLGAAPRRGRLYAAPLSAVRAAAAQARAAAIASADSEPVTTDNYGRAADALRRDLRVVQVWCGAG